MIARRGRSGVVRLRARTCARREMGMPARFGMRLRSIRFVTGETGRSPRSGRRDSTTSNKWSASTCAILSEPRIRNFTPSRRKQPSRCRSVCTYWYLYWWYIMRLKLRCLRSSRWAKWRGVTSWSGVGLTMRRSQCFRSRRRSFNTLRRRARYGRWSHFQAFNA
jgi:hypothetical protein